MAIYTYICSKCGAEEEVWQSIADYSKAPKVPVCLNLHGFMQRKITAPLVTFDTAPWAAYRSPIDGEVIDSRAKRNEHMAKHGVVPFDEIQPDVERNKKRQIAKAFEDLKADVIESAKMVEAGYKPVVESADVLEQ